MHRPSFNRCGCGKRISKLTNKCLECHKREQGEVAIKVVDRYSAAGQPKPDPKTVCRGRCEGMGFFPTDDHTEWPKGSVPDEVGYVFVRCQACGGTGRRDRAGKKAGIKKAVKAIRNVIGR